MIAPSFLLEMLFDRMPMGIAVIDRAYRIQRFNPTWHDYSTRYAPPEGAPLRPGIGYFDHLPGVESTVIPLFARVLAGEVVRQEDVRLELAGVVTYWDVTLTPLVEDGEVIGILSVTVDATERVQAQRNLEQRVEERTRELERRREIAESLAEILSILNSTRSSREIFAYVTQRSCELLRADACLLYSISENVIVHEAHYNLPENLAAMKSGDLYRSQHNLTLLNRHPVAISDAVAHLHGLLGQTDLSPFQRRWYEGLLASFQAYLGIPLIVNDQVFGGLVFYFTVRRAFGAEDIQLAQTLAGHAALAIENARLRQEEQQRRLEAERRRLVAESLRDIIRMINANIPLSELLQQSVELAAQRLNAAACVLHHFDLENEVVSQAASYGMEGIFTRSGSRPFAALRPSGGEAYLRATLHKQPTYTNYPPLPERLDEIWRDPTIPDVIKAERIRLRERYAASFSVPLFIQDKVYGGMVFYYSETQDFFEEQIQLGLTFAEQMALAIENALLRGQAAEMARLAERSRLARDLHDAVTQTLFSASLIADVLPALWERNPDIGRQKLAELRTLTRGALSEMRTLLLELRPDTLADVELGDLCRHLANAFSGRTRVPVAFTQEGQAPLPPPVKEVCYRVTQEALNNIAKHANASDVQLHLNAQPGWVEVTIRDNGDGFDSARLAPENLGLTIMRERAESIGARLSIDSQPGMGTQVQLVWRAERADGSA